MKEVSFSPSNRNAASLTAGTGGAGADRGGEQIPRNTERARTEFFISKAAFWRWLSPPDIETVSSAFPRIAQIAEFALVLL